MDRIKCVILEDEIPAAEELEYIISQHKSMEVMGVANDGERGMELIKIKNPQAVFMDINMPLLNGMEVAKKIREFDNSIDIIFVTAYEQHAIQAFEVDALDYVLKPFDEKRIDKTINRLCNKWSEKSENVEKIPNIINEIINKIDNEERLMKKIPCDRKGKIILVDIKDIYYLYIEGEKTYVKTKDDSYLVGHTLQEIERKTKLFRAHRSYLVNIDNIKELYSWFNGTYKLVMNDVEKSEVPISRNNVRRLKDLLGI